MTDRSRIDATELDGVRLSPDGSRLILLLRDTAGRKVSFSLPTNCLNSMLTAVPHPPDADTVHAVDTWHIALAENGHDMVLTLRTSEGMATSFTIKRWQFQGMATVATYGSTREPASRSIH